MTLHLHRAPRTDLLARALGDLLAAPPDDPFARDVVAVPAKGIERWLSQQLSHWLGTGAADDGVCAAVDFRTPWSLVAEVAGTRDDDPWAPPVLLWPVLDVIDAALGEPWADTLTRHLGTDPADELRRGRRLSVASRMASRFAAYASERPRLLVAWEAGRDEDGLGADLAPDLRWQAELWRRVVTRVGLPTPATRHAAVVEGLRSGDATLDLPDRLSLFGHTRLSVTDVEILEALATRREVHLWLPHPSARLWSHLAAAGHDRPVPRRLDTSAAEVGHPLLASLGRDIRELQRTLGLARELIDHGEVEAPEAPGSLLGWLQHDLRAATVPTAGERAARLPRPDDRSMQVHACHGPARQVEVLREVLLSLLDDDPTLEPRDILVMCPDIETFAPLVHAAFGLGDVVGDEGHPAHRLRVRLADRALHQTNPVLAVLAQVVDLVDSRVTAPAVLDLAHAEPVRRRFGLGDDDLEQLTVWAQDAGVRWGFDPEGRAAYGLDDLVQNTWRFGLDRVLVGVAMSDDTPGWLGATLPLDDVGSSQVELAGRFGELVDRLHAASRRLTTPQSIDAWVTALEETLDALTDVAPADGWQVAQAHRELTRLAHDAAVTDSRRAELRLSDIRELLGARLAGRPTRANFRSGTLTVCTMVPMRSVPHRVVALLGIDDGAFPRVGITDGDDALARDPVTGERDVRSEDRQLFLDAVLAAGETLVVTYTGADPHTGQSRPPAVPLGELIDTLAETAALDGTAAGAAGAGLVLHHPLQPFDPRNLTPGALVAGPSFSFDPDALGAARAAAGPRRLVAPFLGDALDPLPLNDVALDDLVAFARHPVRYFLTSGRLDITLLREQDPPADAIPVELDPLATWGVAERLLTDVVAGHDIDSALQREWRRGTMPPGRLGWQQLRDIATAVTPLARAALGLRASEARAVDVDVDLGDGRRLRGTVADVYGDRLVPVTYSRLAAGHRIQAWVRLLALSAHDPTTVWEGRVLGRPKSKKQSVACSHLTPPASDARALLARLVAMRDLATSRPLPLPLRTSALYAERRHLGSSAAVSLKVAIDEEWEDTLLRNGDTIPKECSDAAHLQVWPTGELPGLSQPPPDEFALPDESTAFGAFALHLWGALLAAESRSAT